MEKWCILPNDLLQELSREWNVVLESLANFCNTNKENLLNVLTLRNTPPRNFENYTSNTLSYNWEPHFWYVKYLHRKKKDDRFEDKDGNKRESFRLIRKPTPELQKIQETIRQRLLCIPVSLVSTAGKPWDSAEKNANIHRYNPYLITLDIKQAYPSISTHRVYKNLEGSLWKALDIRTPLLESDNEQQTAENKKLFVRALTHLCVGEDELPQGSPTSNQIQNIVMRGFDTKIEKKLPELSCSYMTYSRYADDMSISFKQYLTKDVLEEKFSNYVQSIKNADEEKMEGILQQFNQEQFVATDNFERKYINQKIEELKTLITASSQFSEPQKKIYIWQINIYKQKIIPSSRRIENVKDEIVKIIGKEWRKVNPRKIHIWTPQSDTDRKINGLTFDNEGKRMLDRKTQWAYKRLFRELTEFTKEELEANAYYKKRFRIAIEEKWRYSTREESLSIIKNVLQWVYQRIKKVYGWERIPKEITELFKKTLRKRDNYNIWYRNPKRLEEREKQTRKNKEKENYLQQDKQEFYSTMLWDTDTSEPESSEYPEKDFDDNPF